MKNHYLFEKATVKEINELWKIFLTQKNKNLNLLPVEIIMNICIYIACK